MFDGVIILMAAAAYLYYNWQFQSFADECFGEKRKIRFYIGTSLLNYGLFILFTFWQFHLIFNWSFYFLLLWSQMGVRYKKSPQTGAVLAFSSVITGLALNIIFRCLFALVLSRPLTDFDGQVLSSGNMKQYPVLIGFALSGLSFHILRRLKMNVPYRTLLEDSSGLSFLMRILSVLYIYLILNLLTYYTTGNSLILKLWGIKSACFAILGFYLAVSYSVRMSQLKQYAVLNRQERRQLLKETQEDEKLKIIAYADPLTGCYNRKYAQECLTRFWNSRSPFCICFADLNGLKKVNDHYGHMSGDQYLHTVARAIQKNIRQEDMLFRYGGDEFLILFPGSQSEAVRVRMEKVNEELYEMRFRKETVPEMSVSFGVACSSEAYSEEEIVRLADRRMYEHKRKMSPDRREA